MTAKDFVASLYLGDRVLRGLRVDEHAHEVRIHVDLISRVRSPTGNWEFYTDEDITDGVIVLTGLVSSRLEPDCLPNDAVHVFEAKKVEGTKLWKFTLEAACLGQDGSTQNIVCTFVAEDIQLEDPSRPSTKMRE